MYNRKLQPQVSVAKALPAPNAGINDLDPLGAMNDQFVIDSMNFFPDTAMLVARPGYQEWCTNMSGPVKTIMSYNAQDGSFQKFASTDTAIRNISSSSNAPPVVTTCTNGAWDYVNFATPAGQYLICTNGTDAAKLYNGTTWINFTQVTTPSAPGEIKGVDPALFDFVFAHKGRLWFIQKNSMTAWYLPIDAVGGEAKPFFLGGIFRRGGKLVSISRWSSDTGEGLDDRLVFATSTGEIASYTGTDPAVATDWAIDSIFFVAAPLSKRCLTEYGGDLLLLCRRGLVPLSSLISGEATKVVYSGGVSRLISRTLVRLTGQLNFPFPPEVTLHEEATWVVINIYDPPNLGGAIVPGVYTGTSAPIQLVMNFLTGAWGKFNYPVRTVRSIDGRFYMGTDDGRVLIVTPNSFVDNVSLAGTGGVPITCEAMGAYTYLDNPTVNKHAKLMRPVMQTEVKPSFLMRALADFRLDQMLDSPAPSVAAGNARWDISDWDEANWAGLENVYRPWISANVLGYAFAWQIKISTSTAIGLTAVEWVWENGGLV